MLISKNCEYCGKIYQCRKDKINTSRFCSRRCTCINAGNTSYEKHIKRWKEDTTEQFFFAMKTSFETFFKKNHSCWLWEPKKGKKTSEYAGFTFRGKAYKSNRASWMIYRGEIPKEMYVLHTCDVRNCVNPNHLFLGTHADNMKDMALKKRSKPRTKLTIEQVDEIRKALELGVTTVRLAKDYKVSPTCIWYIKHNKSWTDIENI